MFKMHSTVSFDSKLIPKRTQENQQFFQSVTVSRGTILHPVILSIWGQTVFSPSFENAYQVSKIVSGILNITPICCKIGIMKISVLLSACSIIHAASNTLRGVRHHNPSSLAHMEKNSELDKSVHAIVYASKTITTALYLCHFGSIMDFQGALRKRYRK